MAEKTMITRADRELLATLIDDVRRLEAISGRLTALAEDITGDYEMNAHTFDVCHNDKDATVDDLLMRLGVDVAIEEAK